MCTQVSIKVELHLSATLNLVYEFDCRQSEGITERHFSLLTSQVMLLVLLLPQSRVCPPMLMELFPILMSGVPSPVRFPPIEIEGEPFDGTLMLMPGRSIEIKDLPLSLDPRRDALAREQRHRLTMTELLIVVPRVNRYSAV